MGKVSLICHSTDDVYVRNGPSFSYSAIGYIKKNTTMLYATQEENNWFYINNYSGWVSSAYLSIDRSLDSNIETPSQDDVQPAQYTEDDIMQIYRTVQSSDEDYEGESDIDNLITTSLDGIYGVPYQFMSSVDPKIENTRFGAIYADKIIARMPLLLLSPGKVNFMRDYKDKNSAAQAMLSIIQDGVGVDELKDAVTYTGRYYTFDYDTESYYKYVRSMCSTAAYFLNIPNAKIRINGEYVPITEAKWEDYGKNCFKSISSKRKYVAFYVDSATSASESFSNSTTESQLASKINSFSDTGRELRFLLGTAGGDEMLQSQESAIKSAMDTVTDVANKYLKGNQLFTDIANNFSTIAVGGKLIFPEIWADSEFSTSYDINIKLRTPDCDKLSWFMNIFVPLAHLICLTAPREADSSDANGYKSPFLVRSFYKGLFNIDMGIVTDLSITKGREKAWTLDSLPTEVDVSMTIKDLYKMMSISSDQSAGAFVNNLSLMDYIANSCGVNINEPDFSRSVEVYLMLKKQKFSHIWSDAWSMLNDDIQNRIMTTQSKITNLLGFVDSLMPL